MKRTILSILATGVITSTLFGQTQPLNTGFENWEELPGSLSNTFWEPNDWNTSNKCTELLNAAAVSQSSDAHSGSSSARLESLDGPGPTIVMNGVLTTAEVICLASSGGQSGGMPFPSLGEGVRSFPDSIVGWYKYAPVGNDSAYSQIMFLANNDQDTVCFTRIDFHTQPNWTRFSAPICPGNNTEPEKLSLFFSSSWGDGAQGEGEIGSVFFVDDVEFIYPLDIGVGDELNANEWLVYPNPTQGDLNINTEPGIDANIEVLDITGKQVAFEKLNDQKTNINLSKLVAGIYLYQIKSLNNQVLRTGKLLVNP